MMEREEHLNDKTYVLANDGQVVLRQRKPWGEVEDIVLEHEDALKLAKWLEEYCLQEFAKQQGGGE